MAGDRSAVYAVTSKGREIQCWYVSGNNYSIKKYTMGLIQTNTSMQSHTHKSEVCHENNNGNFSGLTMHCQLKKKIKNKKQKNPAKNPFFYLEGNSLWLYFVNFLPSYSRGGQILNTLPSAFPHLTLLKVNL